EGRGTWRRRNGAWYRIVSPRPHAPDRHTLERSAGKTRAEASANFWRNESLENRIWNFVGHESETAGATKSQAISLGRFRLGLFWHGHILEPWCARARVARVKS